MKFIFFLSLGLLQLDFGTCQFNKNELLNLFNVTEGVNFNVNLKDVEIFDAKNDSALPESDCLMDCPFCPKLPKKCPNGDVTFWLYTNTNIDKPEKLTLENPNGIDLSKAQAGSPWKVIIHGYTKSKDETPNTEIRPEYFKKGLYNILSVDYQPLSPKPCYLTAVRSVPIVSECTAQIIDALVSKNAFKISDLHIIGFSLGAQIAGRVYKYLKSGKPGRVTALDPASPLFDGIINPTVTQNSGDFVDIIHTDVLMKGKIEPLGHVDFYPNGGSFQPGCLFNSNQSFSGCNHDRSPEYYAESINTKTGFYGVPCMSYLKYVVGACGANEKDIVIMGEYTPRTARGIYQLQTNDRFPFAMGKTGSKIKK